MSRVSQYLVGPLIWFQYGTDQNSGSIFTIDNESKGPDMTGFGKIVSIGSGGAADMMRKAFQCDKSLLYAAFKVSQSPMPNPTPNPLHVKPSSQFANV
jgi:hypothetical protein